MSSNEAIPDDVKTVHGENGEARVPGRRSTGLLFIFLLNVDIDLNMGVNVNAQRLHLRAAR